MMNQRIILANRQLGVILIISLIMLLALTLIGITSSNVAGLQEKMAGNNKDINLAFQAAEGALRDAEDTAKTNPFAPSVLTATTGTGGVYTLLKSCTGNPTADLRTTTTTPPLDTTTYSTVVWDDATKVKTVSVTPAGVVKAPVYILEQLSCGLRPSSSGSFEAGVGTASNAGLTGGQTVQIRITARGWGGSANAVVTIQSIIKIDYD